MKLLSLLFLAITSQNILAGDEQGSGSSPQSTTSNEDIQYIQDCTQANDSTQVTCTIVAASSDNNH